MANITYPAGIATAYGAAVRGGYTGTYDDFCRQQAQYADSAAAVEQAKEDAEAAANAAEGSKTAAAGSASAAATSAGQASTSATNAANSATAANASKNAAATSATEAGNSATAAAGSASDAQTSADDAQASAEAAAQSAASVDVHADGNYPEMTVGTSEQLLSTQYVTDKTPYLYRTTGGSSDVGNREHVRGITGGTVAWNQLVRPNKTTFTFNGVTVTNNNDGSFTFSGTASASGAESVTYAIQYQQNHKYLISVRGANDNLKFYNGYGTDGYDTGNVCVFNLNRTSTVGYLYFLITSGVVYNVKVVPQIFDLTQMFGTTIADYIYSLEQANAGAGVAFFRKLFPNDYYPYDSGTLKSVEGVSSHEMVGFNQWDEEWEIVTISGNQTLKSKNPIPVFPNTTYYIRTGESSSGMVSIDSVDANGTYQKYIGNKNNQTFTTPTDCNYIRILVPVSIYGATYKNDICINLSWSGAHNGEYKPYEKHSYALDSTLTLRGVPKLDNGSLYYDGDVYAPDGTVTRRYGVVDLGTLSFDKTGSGLFWTDGVKGAIKTSTDTDNATGFMICPLYTEIGSTPISGPSGLNPSPDKVFALNSTGRLFFNNLSYTDAASFKTAMSGVYLVYELATPTTETADPYTEIQICDDFGTEEYVSTSIVPVGHTTDYPANLRDKLQHLPDLASADGNYIVSQSGTKMTLAPLPIVIPAPPTTDGTYTFRATVSNGVPTLSWVAE